MENRWSLHAKVNDITAGGSLAQWIKLSKVDEEREGEREREREREKEERILEVLVDDAMVVVKKGIDNFR